MADLTIWISGADSIKMGEFLAVLGWTRDGPWMDPTLDGPRREPGWTLDRPRMDLGWTLDRPWIDLGWTLDGPLMDPRWTLDGPIPTYYWQLKSRISAGFSQKSLRKIDPSRAKNALILIKIRS